MKTPDKGLASYSIICLRFYPYYYSPVPEIIDPVFTKTSQNARFLLSENERFGLVFVKTRSINSGIALPSPLPSFYSFPTFLFSFYPFFHFLCLPPVLFPVGMEQKGNCFKANCLGRPPPCFSGEGQEWEGGGFTRTGGYRYYYSATHIHTGDSPQINIYLQCKKKKCFSFRFAFKLRTLKDVLILILTSMNTAHEVPKSLFDELFSVVSSVQ